MISITPIEAFKDNYHWLIEGQNTLGEDETWVVDPGDGIKVRQVLEERSRILTGILITHHHWDHVGGIKDLIIKDASTEPVVAGPALDKHPLVNKPLSDGDKIQVCGLNFDVFEVPGHTLNHIAYFANIDHQPPVLFSGDTLFAGGCGRLFEGTPRQMHHSLSKLATLPEETLVYCAHEYTLANLDFALSLEPGNQALNNRVIQCKQARQQGIPTIPSSIEAELETNPFMRVNNRAFLASASAHINDLSSDPVSVFSKIRSLKDNY